MIQDFSVVFEGKQRVRVKTVSFRQQFLNRKVAGIILAGSLIIGLVSSTIFGLLIKSGLKDLDAQQSVKLQLIKEQQKLYSKRSELLKKDTIELAAADLGLYSPKKKQIRRL